MARIRIETNVRGAKTGKDLSRAYYLFADDFNVLRLRIKGLGGAYVGALKFWIVKDSVADQLISEFKHKEMPTTRALFQFAADLTAKSSVYRGSIGDAVMRSIDRRIKGER